ncbi:hypothetical protein AAFF_G00030590 [Aldrovandia affinis]|uniref:Lysine-rich coiled-coil protein 1 n=1 Tax=Aldrovandia affinis TaxID=143900 RepID=A0AAD7WG56_9TELE|nr:hypothetical protein AAFF_G00030590 [Aldrovandia affinis]
MEAESASVPQLGETHLEKSNIGIVESASVPDAETVKNTHNTYNSQSEAEVSSGDVLKSLFTDDFCHVCGAVLQFESHRVSHYEGKKHAQKVRLYMQTKRDEERMYSKLTVFQQKDGSVDQERFCELCNMVFSAPVVAKSHYEGKVHAKNLRKMGLHPAAPAARPQTGDPVPQSSPLTPTPQEDGEKETAKAKEEDKMAQETPAPPAQGVDLSDPSKHCRLCAASFNNPQMAKQHYNGRKHQRNEARFRLLQELEDDGRPGAHLASGTFTCPVCNVTLNSVEMYQAHMQGNKHQQKELKVADLICKSQKKVYDSFQDELADYIQVQKARGLEPKTRQAAEQKEEGQKEEEDKDDGEEEKEGKTEEGGIAVTAQGGAPCPQGFSRLLCFSPLLPGALRFLYRRSTLTSGPELPRGLPGATASLRWPRPTRPAPWQRASEAGPTEGNSAAVTARAG